MAPDLTGLTAFLAAGAAGSSGMMIAEYLAGRALGLLRTVLALEWVAAERALRMRGVPATGVLAGARALASGFDERLEDRPLGGDAALAEAALPSLAELVRAAS